MKPSLPQANAGEAENGDQDELYPEGYGHVWGKFKS